MQGVRGHWETRAAVACHDDPLLGVTEVSHITIHESHRKRERERESATKWTEVGLGLGLGMGLAYEGPDFCRFKFYFIILFLKSFRVSEF